MVNRTDPLIEFSSTLDALLANLSNTGRGRKQLLGAFVDGSLAVAALWGGYSLRHGGLFSDFGNTWHLFLLLPTLTVAIFASLGIYRWSVRSSNQRLYRQVLNGVTISALGLVFVAFLIPPDRVTPRSLIGIYAMLLVFGSCAARAVWRSQFELDRKGLPVAVYGAGDSGIQIFNLLRSVAQFRPTVFIDDAPALAGTQVAGVPVLDGSSPDLYTELQRRDIQQVVLAIPSLSRQSFETRLALFEGFGLPLKVMPSVQDMVDGTFAPGEIRDVSIEDILGRNEVLPDLAVLSRSVAGRSVLITGGGGSIGSELARQVVRLSPKCLVILDSSEENLYEINEELRDEAALKGVAFAPILGSVRQRER